MTVLPDNILRRMSKDDRKSLGKAGMTADEIALKNVAKSEKELQNQIANLLTLRGIWFHRSRMDKRTTGPKGTPDFLFAIKGRAVAVEVKLPNHKASIHQSKTMVAMMNDGWHIRIATSLRDVIDHIKEIL